MTTRQAKAQPRHPGRVPLASIRSAKCTSCEVRWIWRRAQPRVMEAICPVCGKPLERTSQKSATAPSVARGPRRDPRGDVAYPVREADVVRSHVPYSGGVGPMLSVPRTIRKRA